MLLADKLKFINIRADSSPPIQDFIDPNYNSSGTLLSGGSSPAADKRVDNPPMRSRKRLSVSNLVLKVES